MTQTSSPWDGLLVGDAADAPYTANEWARLWAKLSGMNPTLLPNYGVLAATGDGTYPPLFTRAVSGATIETQIGAALVNGKLYENTAAVTLTVGANASGNARIDTVVLRVDYTAQTTRLVLKQGTPAASPARPSLTQSASIWEIPLADVAVANGFSSIAQTDITDRRRFVNTSYAGWQSVTYPVGTNPADDYANSASILANTAIAVPFIVTGNMLLDQLNVLSTVTVNSAINWGVYVEDVNDGAGVSKSVRRIGGRASGGATTSFSNGNMISIPATPPPIPLHPGAYWLILNTSQNISLGAKTPSASRFNKGKTAYLSLASSVGTMNQTVDLSAWATANEQSLAIRMDGRVFDLTTIL